ncbi:hypothetical protein [Mesorhizobium sp. J428]|uniref:hypothetical protein n=1 Tax=Mesorhizobium sp. J428 TaxID=2898440 RepID=UPI002151881F|nr:hypothetical protein [Mesorhizobium sp. J428]MCR5855965.1 hypothetical protein [Mesorhizobium sp. J428]
MTKLFEQAAEVDILDAAGRLIADPERAVVSRAAIVALAQLVERAWEICIEADLLARAVALPADAASEHAIRTQAERVRTLMAALSGETQEKTDGSSDS